jgi:hypothetical protein
MNAGQEWRAPNPKRGSGIRASGCRIPFSDFFLLLCGDVPFGGYPILVDQAIPPGPPFRLFPSGWMTSGELEEGICFFLEEEPRRELKFTRGSSSRRQQPPDMMMEHYQPE